jgi:hypothetical protein
MGAAPFLLQQQARDGTRTHDLFLTKEVLCRLSYASNRLLEGRATAVRRPIRQAGQEGIEPPTAGFGDRCSTN